jgi:hypothetical protein
MSFELKILNGDLVIGTNGDLAKVQDTEKLIQDILKLLMTELGSNPFFPWYGTTLSATMVGSPLEISFLASIAENQIRSGLETIQNLQRSQAAQQKVTPAELFAAIKNVSVVRSQVDPTHFTIYLSFLTKALTIVNTSFNVTI